MYRKNIQKNLIDSISKNKTTNIKKEEEPNCNSKWHVKSLLCPFTEMSLYIIPLAWNVGCWLCIVLLARGKFATQLVFVVVRFGVPFQTVELDLSCIIFLIVNQYVYFLDLRQIRVQQGLKKCLNGESLQLCLSI